MRNPRGTIGVEKLRRMLRLRLPASVATGNRYISLGLEDTPLNRQIAELKAQQISVDISLGQFDHSLAKYKTPAIEQVNIADLWEQYTDYKRPSLAKSTLEKDFNKVKKHIENLPSQNLTQISKIKTHIFKTLTPDAARRLLTALKACFTWAKSENLITHNPLENLVLAKQSDSNRIQPFTKSEIKKIIAAAKQISPYYVPFLEFLFLTGCRPSEAIALRWEQISPDLDKILFSQAYVLGENKTTKTGKNRYFPINSELLAVLKKIGVEQTGIVFLSPTGINIDHHNFTTRHWKPILDLSGVVYRSAYQTRHTFITHCLESGIPVAQVSEWVGSSSKTIWKHYAGITTSLPVPKYGDS